MLSFHCPKCGATTKFDEKKEVPTYCMFCGAHLPDMDNFVKEALRLKQDETQLSHDRERHEMEIKSVDKQIERIDAVNKSESHSLKSIALTFLCVILFLVILRYVIIRF